MYSIGENNLSNKNKFNLEEQLSLNEAQNLVEKRLYGHKLKEETRSIKLKKIFSVFVYGLKNFFQVFNKKTHYFRLSSVQDRELKFKADFQSITPRKLYDHFGDIHRNHSRGSGTCPLRTFAAAQSLIEGKTYIYKHQSRAIVLPREFEKYYSESSGQEKRFQSITEESLQNIQDGSVLVLARPLDSLSCFINKLLRLVGSSSQLSHFCTGIKINGKIHVLELSRNSDTIYEPLEEFQTRMTRRELESLNLFLVAGSLHPCYVLDPSSLSSNASIQQ